MALSESTIKAVNDVENYRCFLHWAAQYQATDKERCLLEAVTYRQQLISSGFATSDFLDGVQEGMKYSGYSATGA